MRQALATVTHWQKLPATFDRSLAAVATFPVPGLMRRETE